MRSNLKKLFQNAALKFIIISTANNHRIRQKLFNTIILGKLSKLHAFQIAMCVLENLSLPLLAVHSRSHSAAMKKNDNCLVIRVTDNVQHRYL